MSKLNLFNLENTDKHLVGRLWRDYIRPYKGRLFLAVFFMTILAAATAGYGWLVAHIIDIANTFKDAQGNSAEQAKEFALMIVPVVIGITLVSGVAMFIQAVLANFVALNVIGRLQKAMFHSIHLTDFATFQHNPSGELISRFINDVTLLSTALLRTMSGLVRDILTIIFCVGMMIYFDWFLTVLVLSVYPLAAVPIIAISKKMRGNSDDAQAQIGTITSQLGESFTGARMVRTYNLEDYEQERLGKSFDERVRLYLKLVTNQARVEPILEVLGGIALASVFALGVYRVTGGHTTGGGIAGLLVMIFAISPRVRSLGTLNNVVQEGLAALHRIFEVIDTKPTIVDSENAKHLTDVKGAVSFFNVGFSYETGTEALHKLDLHANPGETFALVGPSGGGKSTVLNLIARLYDVTDGHIEIDGHNIKDISIASLRDSIALVSQDIILFDDTIAANIGFGKLDASLDEIKNAAKLAAAHDFIMAMPKGYDSRLGESGGKLSGGQKQRISLARAILRDAPILLLDEATSALDAESEAKIKTALDALTKDRTVFIIAHRLSTIRKAFKILVLDKGRLMESGSHDVLMKKNGLYAKLHALQFGK